MHTQDLGSPAAPGAADPPARAPLRRWAIRLSVWAAVAAVLAAVFMSYRQPELMIDLANRLWSCF